MRSASGPTRYVPIASRPPFTDGRVTVSMLILGSVSPARRLPDVSIPCKAGLGGARIHAEFTEGTLPESRNPQARKPGSFKRSQFSGTIGPLEILTMKEPERGSLRLHLRLSDGRKACST